MKTKRFIPGIYNYCDYWCERCAFTRRCRNFSMGREIEAEVQGKQPVDDAVNAAFWNRLAGKLGEARMASHADAWGAGEVEDFDAGPDPEWEAREEARHRAVHGHPLSKLAEDYMRKVHAWLKAADPALKAVANELVEAAGNRFTEEDVEERAREIGEMVEVVAWYHTLIAPKLSRAIRGVLERDDVEGPFAGVLARTREQDANGSGKVALIAVERSIAAWLSLREVLPQQEDEILGMLAQLNRLRHGIGTLLPGAAAFRRPGFDGEANFLADDDEAGEVGTRE